jgi:hypothetical protein
MKEIIETILIITLFLSNRGGNSENIYIYEERKRLGEQKCVE